MSHTIMFFFFQQIIISLQQKKQRQPHRIWKKLNFLSTKFFFHQVCWLNFLLKVVRYCYVFARYCINILSAKLQIDKISTFLYCDKFDSEALLEPRICSAFLLNKWKMYFLTKLSFLKKILSRIPSFFMQRLFFFVSANQKRCIGNCQREAFHA